MSDSDHALTDLVGGCNSTVLPGYVLSRFALEDYGTVEEEFQAQYLETIGKGAARLPESTQAILLDKAAAAVSRGELAWPSYGFTLRAFSRRWLPFLLWVSLRSKHPQTTPTQAAGLITEENWMRLSRAVLTCMEYDLSKNAQGAATATAQPSPTHGPTSSDASSPAADPGLPSAA